MIQLRELKARKAKFGFNYGVIYLGGVIDLAEFLVALKSTHSADTYMLEETGYNRPEMKIYTDNEEVAAWLRQYATLN